MKIVARSELKVFKIVRTKVENGQIRGNECGLKKTGRNSVGRRKKIRSVTKKIGCERKKERKGEGSSKHRQ